MMSKTKKISPRVINILITVITFAIFGGLCWHTYAAGDRKISPSSAAIDAVKNILHDANITQVEMENVTVTIYEVEAVSNEEKTSVKVSGNGEILAVEKEISSSDLPKAVANAIDEEVGNYTIKELEQKAIHALIAVAPLTKPKVIYEVEYDKAGKEMKAYFDNEEKRLQYDFHKYNNRRDE